MPTDIRIAVRVVLAMLALAELVGMTGIMPPPHVRVLEIIASPHTVFILGAYAQTFCVLYLCSRPRGREIATVAVAGALLAGLYLLARPYELVQREWDDFLALYAGGCGAAAFAALILRMRAEQSEQRRLAATLVAAFVLILVYSLFAIALLRLTAALHPRTYDAIAFNLDATLGFDPSIVSALVVTAWPPLRELVTAAYILLPFGCAALYGLQLAQPARAPVSILLAFTVSGAAALFLYHACPIAGPRYAFGDFYYVWWAGAPNELVTVRPAPRNGMPSMHFGWALLLWMNAAFIGSWARAFFALLLGLTALATLALGEHYLVDLVAAAPWMVAMQALCATGLGWACRERVRALAWGAALLLGWILAVRYGVGLFAAVPGLAWAAMAGTLAASAALYRPLARALRAAPPGVLAPARERAPADSRGALRPVWVMFVVSGFAGLVYEVLFSKVLALTFGSQATATYTVLATYMGGMALGAWLGGWWAQRRADALRLYGWCELGIGAYCLATPLVFAGIQALYVGLAQGLAADAPGLVGLRVGLGVVGLAVPTVLMGATLPILARYAQGRAVSLGVSVGLLYGANTVGAALGALLGGYLIIPLLGVWKTTLAAAGLNFAVAWLALRLARGAPPQALPQGGCEPARVAAPPAVPGRRVRALGGLALVVLAVGGVVTLALEVNYIHLLAVVAGNSVYAFSLMLFAFLLGLGGGAEIARRLLKFGLDPAWALAWLQFALAGLVLGGVFLWEGLPRYFASFEGYPLHYGFGARELVRALVCLVALLPPALLIGMIYPVAMECVGRAAPQAAIAALGRAAALNTAGNIAGVLVAGFVLLPQLGALRSIQLLAGLSAALGVLIVVVAGLAARPLAWVPAVLVLALAAVQPHAFDYTALASGANVYFRAQPYGRVIAAAESADGGLTTVAEQHVPGRGRLLTLLTNGKFQGSNDPQGEVVAQIGIALAPLLHTAARERALVIGYGTGTSARVFKEAGFRALDIVELSADIVRLADTHFAEINARVSTQAGVNTYLTDGRNFLLLQPRTYDVVSLEVSSIWFAGAAALYNREFYQLVKRRLAPHGVLQQWVQLHHIYPADLLTVLGTVRAEFSYVWLYLVGGQGIIVATNDPASAPHPAHLQALERTSALAPLLAQLPGGAAGVLAARLLEPAATERLLARFGLPLSAWVSTDDNLRLEYSTPKGNALDGLHSLRQNIEWLRQHSSGVEDAPRG
jgi:predicted membrane-bound spermidine synthase